jgi:hypothetical protein
MDLARFIGSTLQRLGGLAEPGGGETVEALLPAPVAASLGLPEEARLRWSGAPSEGEAHAGYGSALLAQLCSLAEGTGRRHRLEMALPLPKMERVAREAESALSFRNAVGRVEAIEPALLDYQVYDFHYAALSEERHEGILAVAVAPGPAWNDGLGEALPRSLADHPEARRPWPAEAPEPDLGEGLRAARRLAAARALADAGPFVARMERRVLRDVRRVEEYYDTLRREVEQRRSRGREAAAPPDAKVEAVEGERRRRLHDLRRRYAVTLCVEPLAVLALRVSGLRLRARLRRRQGERSVCLGWNPVSRRFDQWVCAACGAAAGLPALCDRLHFLCAACPPECPGCGRDACPACRPGPCACGRRSGPQRDPADM